MDQQDPLIDIPEMHACSCVRWMLESRYIPGVPGLTDQ